MELATHHQRCISDAERYIQVLELHMIPFRLCLFQGRPCIFKQDYGKLHTASVKKQHGFIVQVLYLPDCNPDLSQTGNQKKLNMIKKRPRTVEELESHVRQEWDNITLPKALQLVSS